MRKEKRLNYIGILAPSLGVATRVPVPVAIVGGVVGTGLAAYGAYRLYQEHRQKKDQQASTSEAPDTSEEPAT